MSTPKEQLTAYQRWEMNSFDPPPPPAPVAAEPHIKLPTQEEIEAMMESARAEGYETGRAQGYQDGLALGRAEAATEQEHLRSIAATFGSAVARADETIANEVLELALQLARAMLRTALEVKPELILHVVREAIGYLPVLQQPASLYLHPADAELVRDAIGHELAETGWTIKDDSALARGGCRIDTASNQIDATVQARWARLTAAVAKNVEWLG
ncbi:flagellar assembly protein FliH [Massilia arenosa]|uniref:Flagellar assembly protein FliH n=1 Tax=Zemynaea arenosa TaxID=2561931 RepID=A0A4Y9SXB1_9BURK|nr:flagellar assembly protein FliH [Massilia arenosa]TFW30187.1 flagellar assembly protein FliH [Massilia arenosa]